MALSKKGKNTLIITFSFVGAIILVIGVFFVLSMFVGYGKYTSNDYDTEPISPFIDSYQSSDTKGGLELDSLNYDEANTESKIRKTGTVSLTVDNIEEVKASILESLYMYNGTVVSSNQMGRGNEKSLSITVKVPVEYFEDIYENIQKIDGEVTYANYYTDDVTQEYVDLESRLNTLEATEKQLVEILKRAQTVEDTLAVYDQLTDIRSRIEVIKGQLKYLDSQVDYSYLTVNLSLSDTGKEITDKQWRPLGVVKSAFSALIDFGIYIVDALIWILVFSPLVAILVGIVILIKKKSKNKK